MSFGSQRPVPADRASATGYNLTPPPRASVWKFMAFFTSGRVKTRCTSPICIACASLELVHAASNENQLM